MTELERYDTSRALFLVLGECCRIIVDLGEADAAATDQQPGPASVAHQPKRRHKTKTKSWLPFLLVFVATSFVTALAYWKFGLVLEAIEESAQVLMSRPFGGAVMIDETTLVLLAFGAMGLLGIFLLAQRIRRAVRVNRILKAGNRILKAGGPWEPSRQAAKGWTVGLVGGPKDKVIEQTFRNMFFTAAGKGEGLIEYYMIKHKCGRTEAMRRAIEEREREGRMFG